MCEWPKRGMLIRPRPLARGRWCDYCPCAECRTGKFRPYADIPRFKCSDGSHVCFHCHGKICMFDAEGSAIMCDSCRVAKTRSGYEMRICPHRPTVAPREYERKLLCWSHGEGGVFGYAAHKVPFRDIVVIDPERSAVTQNM